jgi:hypothetical protein
VLEQVAAVRFHAGAVGTPWTARPEKATSAVAPFEWPVASASAGTTWQVAQVTGLERPWVAARCASCVPTRTASAERPQTVFGGAPVWLPTPPWQKVQLVLHVAPWHCAQETVVVPPTPSRAAPWQGWQEERFELEA